ncbi:hypothetical protein [Mycolicibacterium mucogenicum]|nr:hypothetical protein [Mycolicibacterium mucogenicum]
MNGADEYTRRYVLAKALYAGYRDYRIQTGRAGRCIPILRLARR